MGYYGLAAKAGKIVCGADAVKEAIKYKKVFVVIIAEDSSLATQEKFMKYASENNVLVYVYGNIFENSKAIGKRNKAIIAIRDEGFARAISKVIDGGDAIGQNAGT